VDSDRAVQEEALKLIMNVSHQHSEIIMDNENSNKLIGQIEYLLYNNRSVDNNTKGKSCNKVALNALYCVCNIANGKGSYKDKLVDRTSILESIYHYLVSKNKSF
jgi:hypothetical protein